jgi:hypothetical protein
MNYEIEIQSGPVDEAYEAPDVVRLGTAEGLTAASAGTDFTGDCTSTIC